MSYFGSPRIRHFRYGPENPTQKQPPETSRRLRVLPRKPQNEPNLDTISLQAGRLPKLTKRLQRRILIDKCLILAPQEFAIFAMGLKIQPKNNLRKHPGDSGSIPGNPKMNQIWTQFRYRLEGSRSSQKGLNEGF